MKKLILPCVIVFTLLFVGCSGEVIRNKPQYRYVNSEIESCIELEDGRYDVVLKLEDGNTFKFTSPEDVTKISEDSHINMGYNFEEKVTLMAVIEPSN